MAVHSRIKVLTQMMDIGLVPVFNHADHETSYQVIKALAEGGALCIEWTNRGDGAISLFTELINSFKKSHPDLIMGVGSIVDAPTAALYIAQGANFVVGPCIDEETAVLCNKRKIPYMPGCGSVSEIQKAESLGVEICKVFPGSEVGGPKFVKAIKGPRPWTSMMPTGGVDPSEESLKEWFDAGIVCAGMGSKLITKDVITNKNYDVLKNSVAQILGTIKKIRGS